MGFPSDRLEFARTKCPGAAGTRTIRPGSSRGSKSDAETNRISNSPGSTCGRLGDAVKYLAAADKQTLTGPAALIILNKLSKDFPCYHGKQRMSRTKKVFLSSQVGRRGSLLGLRKLVILKC